MSDGNPNHTVSAPRDWRTDRAVEDARILLRTLGISLAPMTSEAARRVLDAAIQRHAEAIAACAHSGELAATRDPIVERPRLITRAQWIREDAVLNLSTIQHWNRTHPTEPPIATAFEDAMIAWCDGKGPIPTLPPGEHR